MGTRNWLIAVALVAVAACSTPGQALAQTYRDSEADIEARIEDLLSQMTVAEKVDQLGGGESGMDTPVNERLGIPALKMADGPHGCRWGQSTCFPPLLGMGATWDENLMERVAAAMGREFRGHGRYVALGPCINIIRDSRGGRSFETFGEDPWHLSRMAVAYVRGMQSEKVVAVAKHFACNNKENDRGNYDVRVGERTLREHYLPHFRACVEEADVLGVMSAYNRVNSPYCTASAHLQRDILKDEWGFRGFVVSDWGACHSTVGAITGGMDVEMPRAFHYGEKLLAAVEAGEVKMSLIDDAVRRVLRTKFWAGVFEEPVVEDLAKINTPEHQELAREAIQKAIVLLKNDGGVLPINLNEVDTIAVIGPNAAAESHTGGGSAAVSPFYSVSALEGIQSRVGDLAKVVHAAGLDEYGDLEPVPAEALTPLDGEEGQHGLLGEFYLDTDLRGEPVLTRVDPQVKFNWRGDAPAEGVPQDGFSVRWRGTISVPETGDYWLATRCDDGSRLFIDGKRVINDWGDHAAQTRRARVRLEAGLKHAIKLEYYENSGDAEISLLWASPGDIDDGMAAVQRAASEADVAIIAVGTNAQLETEGKDRDGLALPPMQDELIQTVRAANPNTVVLAISGSAVLMDRWIDSVPAVLQCWFGGQEAGNGIASVLFGDVNPSGRLPLTIPRNSQQMPDFGLEYEFAGEGRGYKYYDRLEGGPLFPFGHGLSYTSFEYSDLRISPERVASDGSVKLSVRVRNTGDRTGGEVVQVYVADVECSLPKPLKELKAFRRVSIEPGETQDVELEIAARDLAIYDVNKPGWVVEPGRFEVLVGRSAQDILLKAGFEVK